MTARCDAELGHDALEDAVDQSDVAVIEAGLEVGDGVGADDFGGALDVHAAEAGGAGEQGVGADAEAGGDGAAEVFAACGDDVEGGRGAEVDHDARAAVALEGGDGIDEAISAQFGGIVDEDGHAGLDAGFDEEGLDAEVLFADLAQCAFDGRDDAGDDDVADLIGVHAVHLEKIDEEDAVLVGGLVVMGGDAPVGGEFGLGDGGRLWLAGSSGELGFGQAVEAEYGVGVADVEREQHGPT